MVLVTIKCLAQKVHKRSENNVHWGSYLANDLERRNAHITSMNHMLWQLEIHAQSIVAHIHADTQYIKFVVTQSLRLRVCFHIQIKPVFQQLFFYQVHAKHPSPFGIQESPSLFSPSRYTFFQKPLLLSFDLQNFRRMLVIVSFKKTC